MEDIYIVDLSEDEVALGNSIVTTLCKGKNPISISVGALEQSDKDSFNVFCKDTIGDADVVIFTGPIGGCPYPDTLDFLRTGLDVDLSIVSCVASI